VGEEEKQQDPSIPAPAPDPSPPRDVNTGDGEADEAPGGGLREPSTSSFSGSDEEDIEGDSDAARESPRRGDAKRRPWRRVNMARNKSSGASSDGEVGSRVSPSRGTVRHRPGYHDSRGPPPRRAKLDGENESKCHISGNG
ncbi:unnamed protein product, partial [Ectocarpus sp. 8 AP-2014]